MSAETSSDSDPISPELALVDPELAERARRDLPRRRNDQAAERPAPPTLIYMPRPARTAPPAPPPTAPAVAAPAPPRSRRSSRRRRITVAVIVVYALVGWVAFRVARHELHRHRASQLATSPSPGAEAEAPSPTRAEPKPPKPPSASAQRSRPRTFVWLAVQGSTFYEVRIFRKDTEIFEARTTRPRLILPRTWRYGGTTYRLSRGTYRWLVLPGFGPQSSPRYGAAVVSATLRVGR